MRGRLIKVGLVGYGYWGPNLARNFHQLVGCELVACCDSKEERLAEAGRLYPSVAVTPFYSDLLEDSSIEALAIATPARTHYRLARKALLADKHVFVEKPLTMSSQEAEELIALARERQRILMVGHIFEYNPAVLKIKELIKTGEIGQVYYIYSNRVNLGRVRSDINALWSITPHDISILLYLLNTMPINVTAIGASYLNARVEDVVFVTMTFPGGVLGHIQASWLDPSKVRKMTIVGSRKMILYDDLADEGKIKIYEKGVYHKGKEDIYGEFQYKIHSGDIHIPKIDMREPLRLECEHFIECVRTGRQALTDGENGLRVVKILEAAQRSLEQGGATVAIG